jgi:hypothetical protein
VQWADDLEEAALRGRRVFVVQGDDGWRTEADPSSVNPTGFVIAPGGVAVGELGQPSGRTRTHPLSDQAKLRGESSATVRTAW